MGVRARPHHPIPFTQNPSVPKSQTLNTVPRSIEMVQTQAVRQLTFIQAVNEALRQEMERDPAVIIMGEDIAGGAGRPDK